MITQPGRSTSGILLCTKGKVTNGMNVPLSLNVTLQITIVNYFMIYNRKTISEKWHTFVLHL